MDELVGGGGGGDGPARRKHIKVALLAEAAADIGPPGGR
jgi:hypothetical protein